MSKETIRELLEHKKHFYENYGIKLKQPNQEIIAYLSSTFNRELISIIYANRYETVEELKQYLDTKVADLVSKDFLSQFPDINKAKELILSAIRNNEKILVVTDYDVDGVTSAVLAYKMLLYLFEYDNFHVIINKREYGNGINDVIRDQIIDLHKEFNFNLLITADHGSHDASNIKKIKEATRCKAIVTDHHLFSYEDGTAPLTIADAFINPQRDDCKIGKKITGANVLYFTLLYVFLYYLDEDLNQDPNYKKFYPDIPNMNKIDYYYYLITYVGLTIISDSVSVRYYVNKKFLIKALSTLNSRQVKHDTFWTVVLEHLGMNYYIDEVVLAFNVVPALNSPGRIDNPRLSFELMTSEDIDVARILLNDTLEVNNKRKEKQVRAKTVADKEVFENGKVYVAVIEDSSGIQGIAANNILFSNDYEIVICFTRQKDKDGNTILIGSGRSRSPTSNLVEILDELYEKYGIIINHGGHAQAAGVKIEDRLSEFYQALTEITNKLEFKKEDYLYVDDIIISNKKLVTSFMDVKEAGPYGMDNPVPTFASDVTLVAYRIIKKPGARYLLMDVKLSEISNFTVKVFYTLKDNEDDLIIGLKQAKRLLIVYSLNLSLYMGQKKVQLAAESIKIVETRED